MNPRDGSPTDHYGNPAHITHFLGFPFREWLDVKTLANEEGISIRGLVNQYRLLKSGGRMTVDEIRARLKPVVNKGMIWEAENELRLKIDKDLIAAAMHPGAIENMRRPVYVCPIPMQTQVDRLREGARRAYDDAEAFRARESLLEERVASLERRLRRLANV